MKDFKTKNGFFTGNVGIGTTNPSRKLEVSNGDIIINDQNNGATRKIYFDQKNSGGASVDFSISSANGNIDFRSEAQNKSYLYLQSGGNVGIGTTNPGRALEVVGDTSGKIIRLTPQTGKHAELNTGSTNFIIAVNDSSSSALLIRHDTSFVGIGLSNTAAASTSERLLVSGKVRADSGILTSDDRVKHNEQPIVGALETLGKITPKKYIKTYEIYDADHDFELDEDGNPVDVDGAAVNHHIEAGVIAQQVLTVDELAFAVSPESVDEDGVVTSPHGLDYNSLFTYAIAAIQEQQSIIEDLKSQNESLAARISALES